MPTNKHFFISGNKRSESYTSPSAGPIKIRIPERNRDAHSEKLLNQFEAIWNAKAQMEEHRTALHISTREGTYISFTGAADHDLITKSLENTKGKKSQRWIRLLNVKSITSESGEPQTRALVYIPKGEESHFMKKLTDYRDENYRNTTNPKNASLVNSIEDISLAILESFWTDKSVLIPSNEKKWCEVWLNVNTKDNLVNEQLSQFYSTLENIGIEYKHNSTILFPERTVLLIYANREQLVELMLQSDLLAELRGGQELAGFWVNESRAEQQLWIDDLLNRIQIIESNVKVCILDSGVNFGHQLLQPVLNEEHTLTVNPQWGTDDHVNRTGHGTLMAGIAVYGEFEKILVSKSQVLITHKLCSVKILPRPNQQQTNIELWGDITIQGISRAEINDPDSNFVFCLSVTANEDTYNGRPSSWSGAIDNLAFGDGENQRLIIISAGNMSNYYPDLNDLLNYPNINYISSIQNPSQAWNALVVGAFTEKIRVDDHIYNEYRPLANEGQLSPHSTTSKLWENKWPNKPDVVFEGGNLLKSPDNIITTHEDLELLSTSKSFNIKPFGTINATSAAAAQASWFAAKIAFEYPNAWPETIRGLMVHSASWNTAMLSQLNVRPNSKADFGNLLKTFGFGVPNINNALYNQESAFTYIVQETIQPFIFNSVNKQPEINEIQFYKLPWPRELLLEMDRTPVKFKITLSYFIEPGAGEIGWKDKYRYQSHGLRFDINNIDENEDAFRKRVNIAAREENEDVNTKSGSSRWKIGRDIRSKGSIHSDIIELTAAEFAECNLIAIYPVIGWWRERKHLGKVECITRYSLIISLETPAQDVELYTAVKNLIEVPIEIRTN